MKASILLLMILGMISINVVAGGPIEDPKQEASSENINKNATISDIDVHSRRKRSKDDYTKDMAKAKCRAFGSEWDVAKETSGSIVCTKGVSWYNSLDSCDNWRLMVFKSGSDVYGLGIHATHAGSYYGGYNSNLSHSYPWCGCWHQETPQYFLTHENELCAGNVVDDLEKCKDAIAQIKKTANVIRAAPNATFKASEDASDYPKGCYLFSTTDSVYFNEHPTGSSHKEARHICEVQCSTMGSSATVAPTTIATATTSAQEIICPNEYPFAYQNGERCCWYGVDKKGADITIASSSCYNDKFVACPGGICSSGYTKATNRRCTEFYGAYSSMLAAQYKCTSDPDCQGVHGSRCDDSYHFDLCAELSSPQVDTHNHLFGCVYTKKDILRTEEHGLRNSAFWEMGAFGPFPRFPGLKASIGGLQ